MAASYLGADVQPQTVSLADADAVIQIDFRLGTDLAVLDNVLVVSQRGQPNSAINRQRASIKTAFCCVPAALASPQT